MRKVILSLITILWLGSLAGQPLSPFLEAGKKFATENEAATLLIKAANDSGFRLLGDFRPGNSKTLRVLVFTRSDLEKVALSAGERGALAAALKCGLRTENGTTQVTIMNPEYTFNAYFGESGSAKTDEAQRISNQLISSMKTNLGTLTPMGGEVEKEKLWKYKYMMGMPDFNDPVKLAEFNSFAKGVETIEKNLNAKAGKTMKVYSLIYPDKKVAVFGVAFNDPEKGEAHYLPIIGDKHIAALPYEIILTGEKATMLHGRYRIALHWPSLTMGTFTKIMSTPGNIEEQLKLLVQ